MKRLIVNADDFGFTSDVNQGIIVGHSQGVLTATTLMAYGPAFDDALRLSRENPTLDVGCHLTLVGAPPYPATVARLIEALALRRIRVYDELYAQVAKIADSGIRPTHLDTHKHTHLLPPVLDAVARVSEAFQIPWVRRPFDLPMHASGADWLTRATSKGFGFLRGRFHRVLCAHGCRTTDHFAGFQMTGRFDGPELARLIRRLPEGTTEFMCHPGVCTDELRAAPTRLRESRQRELDALLAPCVRQALTEARVELVTYRDL